MKKIIVPSLLASCLVLSSSFLFAEGMANEKKSKTERHLQHMIQSLNLTDDQVENIKPILDQQRESIRAIKQQTKELLTEHLTDEQQQKMAEMQSHRKMSKKY